MSLQKLHRSYEERRTNLIDTLQKGRDEMEPSKQHQLYGAIKEIEHFLQTIDSVREEMLGKADFELKREGPQAISTRAGIAIKSGARKTGGAMSSVVVGFYDIVFRGTGRAFKRGHKRVRMYKQALREVKKREQKDD